MNKGTLDYIKSIMNQNTIDICAIIEPMAKADNIGKLARILKFDEFIGKKGKALRDFNEFITKAGVADVGFKEHRRKYGIFKFVGAWTEHENFQDIVKTSWAQKAHSNPLLNFALKLKRLRRVLRKWNWEQFRDVNLKLRQLTKRVELLELELQNRTAAVSKSTLNRAKDELASYLRYQYAILEEKSKTKWLTDGDRNSSFFHASIKARHSHNKMKLELADGSFSEDPDIIGNKAVTYFLGLFRLTSTREWNGSSKPKSLMSKMPGSLRSRMKMKF
ncbi:hypothetical protein QQ045_031193 [Rhodiola kirilowii]